MATKKSAPKKSAAKKSASKKSAGKRTLIAPKGNKRFVKRDEKGRIKESDDQSRSLSADRRQKAKTEVKSGEGDKGDMASKSASKKSGAKKSGAKKSAGKKSAAKKK